MENTLFIHKDCLNSPLSLKLQESNPTHKVIPISSNTNIIKENYQLVSLNPKERFRQKKKFIGLLKREAKWSVDFNGRSTDFLPSLMMEQGCFKFGCSYCYTERNYPNNFLKIYNDLFKVVDLCKYIEANQESLEKKFIEINKKSFEKRRDPKHPDMITVDLGCDSDVVTSNSVTLSSNYYGHMVEAMNLIAESTSQIMTSFATKSSDLEPFLKGCKSPARHRVRFSLMPENHRVILEQNTSKILDRLNMANDLVKAGFEVHFNLSPIVVTENFEQEYSDLLHLIDKTVSQEVKNQMAYEIIFVTHSDKVNDSLQASVPKALKMIKDGPMPLVPKWNKPNVLSYSKSDKNILKSKMKKLISEITPYSRIRYMF